MSLLYRLDQYPICLLQSQAHITPLLNSQLDNFARPMIILNQFHISSAP